jgi:hypothetical protein
MVRDRWLGKTDRLGEFEDTRPGLKAVDPAKPRPTQTPGVSPAPV